MDRETYPENFGGTLPAVRVLRKQDLFTFQVFNFRALTTQEEASLIRSVYLWEARRESDTAAPDRSALQVYLANPQADYLFEVFEPTVRITEDPDTVSYRFVAYGWRHRSDVSEDDSRCAQPLSAVDSSTPPQTAGAAEVTASTPDTSSESLAKSTAKSPAPKKACAETRPSYAAP